MIDSIVTSHPITAAQRSVTTNLLRETYLVPRSEQADIAALIAEMDAPWVESFVNAPHETVGAVSAGLRQLMLATRRIDPDEIDVAKLEPGTRLNQLAKAVNTGSLPVSPETESDLIEACREVQALRADLLRALGKMPRSEP